jgi:hypothetical protein
MSQRFGLDQNVKDYIDSQTVAAGATPSAISCIATFKTHAASGLICIGGNLGGGINLPAVGFSA